MGAGDEKTALVSRAETQRRGEGKDRCPMSKVRERAKKVRGLEDQRVRSSKP